MRQIRIVGLLPANGMWAVYSNDPGFCAEPLIGFAVHAATGGGDPDRHDFVVGSDPLVCGGGEVVDASSVSNFVGVVEATSEAQAIKAWRDQESVRGGVAPA